MQVADRVKGVVLAGGTGSRLSPLTKVVNKHLLPVGRYPMIYYPVAKLVEAGLRDILIVTGPDHLGAMARLLGSGSEWGARFTYRVQDGSGGIADGLALAEPFANGSPVVVLLGDNIFEASIGPCVDKFLSQGGGARIQLTEVADPERYGVAVVEAGRVVRIEEKPARPESCSCVTGIYMYGPEVFDVIRGLEPSPRGELEISDVNNHFIRAGAMAHDELPGWWVDAGTVESLLQASTLALRLPPDALPRAAADRAAACR